jgi:hypothetical protein
VYIATREAFSSRLAGHTPAMSARGMTAGAALNALLPAAIAAGFDRDYLSGSATTLTEWRVGGQSVWPGCLDETQDLPVGATGHPVVNPWIAVCQQET